MIVRSVPLDDEQFHMIEDLGLAALRTGDQDMGTKLLAIALAWKVAPTAFHCDIDESAGMAEVVALQGYSKRVPCA